MSAIAGIYHLDGHPADIPLLQRMMRAMSLRGPDGGGHWFSGPVALAHGMLHTTPESLREEQPLTDEAGALCLTFDGRVDNRDELRAALSSHGVRLRSDTDAELVLRAYQAWGEDCPRRLLGDFAFAIWDGRERQLFCARDILGLRPLYYRASAGQFLFASELHALLEGPEFVRRLNEGMVAEYLAGIMTSQEETLFEGILRLPPAHGLMVREGRVRRFRYWNVDPQREIRYRTDAEYVDHFCEILREAVRCRLRSPGPLGAHLSGGVDSSSVVATAQHLFRDGAAEDHGFETFSLIFPGLPCDESAFSRAVAERWNCRANYLPPATLGGDYYDEQARRYQDFPDYPNGGPLTYPVHSVAQAKGIRVMLTGQGGNYWLEGRQEHLADLLRGLRIVAAFRQACDDTTFLGASSPARLLWQYGLKPLAPPRLKRAAKQMLGRSVGNLFPWIPRDFAQRIALADRLQPGEDFLQFQSLAKRAVHQSGFSSVLLHWRELTERTAAQYGIEERHPLHDRRLIEFALAVPHDQLWRERYPKYILRQALGGSLPVAVRERIIQAEFTCLLRRAFEQWNSTDRPRKLAIASRGWVDAKKLQELYEQASTGTGRALWAVSRIRGIEAWFRAAFPQGRSSEWNPNPSEQVALQLV